MSVEHIRRDVVPAAVVGDGPGGDRAGYRHRGPLLHRHRPHNHVHVRHLHERRGERR